MSGPSIGSEVTDTGNFEGQKLQTALASGESEWHPRVIGFAADQPIFDFLNARRTMVYGINNAFESSRSRILLANKPS